MNYASTKIIKGKKCYIIIVCRVLLLMRFKLCTTMNLKYVSTLHGYCILHKKKIKKTCVVINRRLNFKINSLATEVIEINTYKHKPIFL